MVDAIRKALESLYTGLATVVEHKAVVKPNHTTGFEDIITMRDIPCRLSYGRFPAVTDTGTASGVSQEIKLFAAPEATIKPGSKVIVTQNGVTTEYMSSGVPAMHSRHQEILLTLFEKWS